MAYDVAIVGAGAAGMYCACKILSKRDASVALIDSNSRPGRKLLMTGGGRCNISNDSISPRDYHTDSMERLEDILTYHNTEDFLAFITDELGVLTSERSGLYYPSTFRSETVVNSLAQYITGHGGTFIGDTTVTSIKHEDGLFKINRDIASKTVVIATGGASYPVTGSNGSFISLLAPFTGKDDMEALYPALVPLKSSDSDIRRLSGIRVMCDLTLYGGRGKDQVLSSSSGELLFTDYGVSGICVLDVSGDAVRAMAAGNKPVLSVNMIKTSSDEAVSLVSRLCSIFPDRSVKSALMGVLREEITDVILARLKLSKDMKAGDADGKIIRSIADMMTSFKININGSLGFDNAQITSGGLKLSSLTKSLEIEGHKGLFACGEMLDCNGICGGYNLQFAWSSAAVAADGVLSCLN